MRVIILLLLCFISSLAFSGPIQWKTEDGGNGHCYEAISTGLVYWATAKTNAESLTHLGQSGYLATITSGSENSFVASLIEDVYHGFYLGAVKIDPSEEPEEGWGWITGEPWVYANWHVADDALNDDTVTIAGGISGADFGEWEDLNGAIDPQYYIVEWDIPEPTTLLLLGLGGLLIRKR